LGCAPDPAGIAYSASPDPLAVFKGPTSKVREEEGEGKGRERGKEGEGRGGEGKGGLPPIGESGSSSGFVERVCRGMP